MNRFELFPMHIFISSLLVSKYVFTFVDYLYVCFILFYILLLQMSES